MQFQNILYVLSRTCPSKFWTSGTTPEILHYPWTAHPGRGRRARFLRQVRTLHVSQDKQNIKHRRNHHSPENNTVWTNDPVNKARKQKQCGERLLLDCGFSETTSRCVARAAPMSTPPALTPPPTLTPPPPGSLMLWCWRIQAASLKRHQKCGRRRVAKQISTGAKAAAPVLEQLLLTCLEAELYRYGPSSSGEYSILLPIVVLCYNTCGEIKEDKDRSRTLTVRTLQCCVGTPHGRCYKKAPFPVQLPGELAKRCSSSPGLQGSAPRP